MSAELINPTLTPSLGAVLTALAVLLYSEARLRRARAAIKEATARAIDAQRAAGATRRSGDPQPADLVPEGNVRSVDAPH